MILTAKREMGLIKIGMRFVFVRDNESHIETYCIELNMNFKLSKDLLDENFTIRHG